MKKENLKQLLIDLYTFYNPEHLMFVDQLVEKYHRMEHSAVEMILIRYNHKNNPKFYDPSREGDEFIHTLIKEYENGNRIFQDAKINNLEQPKEEPNKLEEKLYSIEEKQLEREKEIISNINDYKKIIEELTSKKQNISHFDAVDIKINLFYTETEIELPNKEILASLGIGSRILVLNKQNKPIGLEVKDITYDCVSNVMMDSRPTLEITLDRV